MSANVVIISRFQLVRQGIARRVALCGFTVHEHADTSSGLQTLNELIPDLMILDAEDVPWSWKAVVSNLAATHRAVRVVLVVRRMGIDEAAEAKRLGVSGVILKPFREEEHMLRLVELINRVRGVVPRRAHFRYYPEPETSPMLALSIAPSALYRVVNVSRGGVCLAEGRGGLRAIEDAGEDAPVRLSIGGIHLVATCRVVHSGSGVAGVRFTSMTSGRVDFQEHIGSLWTHLFGPRRINAQW